MRSADLLLVVRPSSPALLGPVRRRLSVLPRLYGALGEVRLADRWLPGPGALVVGLRLGSPGFELADSALFWGNPPRGSLAERAALLGAADSELRALPTPCAALAWEGSRLRLASSSGSIQVLYGARGGGAEAWSTHALAAGLAALERLDVDPEGVAELIACEYVGGERTMLSGVRALEPATVVELDGGPARLRSCFPAPARWAPLEPADSRRRATGALLAQLGQATGSARAPVLGMTAGLDSRTVAVALAELGVSFTAFTFDFGEGAVDVAGARSLAGRLGVPHALGEPRWWRDEEGGIERLLAEAAWFDGCGEVGYGEVRWPERMDRWITGLGGETGRAFYWRWAARGGREPRPGTVERVLWAGFEGRLAGAEPSRVRALRARWAAWIAEARGWGHRGWSALDVVYANHRVRRWVRDGLPRNGAAPFPALAGPEITRALVSLPIEDRLRDGWERSFIAARRPDLLPPAAPPRAARRSPGALAGRRLLLSARSLRRRLGLPARPPRAPEVPWHRLAPWPERPAYVEWLLEDALRSPLLAEALGERWLREQRERVVAGDWEATRLALRAARPVALRSALTATGH